MTWSRAFALGGLLWTVAAACELAQDGGRPVGARCSGDGDCQSGLHCQYGRCRQACAFDRDCEDGTVCVPSVDDPSIYVCTLSDEGSGHGCPDGLSDDETRLCRRPCNYEGRDPDAECGPSQTCSQGWCWAMEGTCEDDILNQNELTPDCGGVCEPCILEAIMVDHVQGEDHEDTAQEDSFFAKHGQFGNPDWSRMAFLKFDLTAILPGSRITRAAVRLSLDQAVGTPGDDAWDIGKIVDGNGWVNNNWDHGITWMTKPAVGELHTPEGQNEYVINILAGPVALRPELIDPGGLYGLSFWPSNRADAIWTGSEDVTAYQLELD